MTSLKHRVRGSLLWLGRHAGRLHAVGWLMFVGAVVTSCSAATDTGDWTFRYLPERIVSDLGRLVLSGAVLCSLIALVVWRRARRLPALVATGALLAIFPPRVPFKDGSLSQVCSDESGCYFLTIAPVFTDTVYDIWHAPGFGGLIWYRLQVDQPINYSEDGSYRSQPRIALSGNGRILVLARGGYLVDAIDLSTKRRLSSFIGWDEPDRDALMQANSDRIEALLAENR